MRFWTISIVLVFAATSYVECQQASQSNKVSYDRSEGRDGGACRESKNFG